MIDRTRRHKLLKEVSEILANAYPQILIIYIIAVYLAYSGHIYVGMLNFELFALILGILGVLYVKNRHEIHIPPWILIIPTIFMLITRISPYIKNNIPLGYDPGIYKYIFDIYFYNLPYLPLKLESWINVGYPPGLFIFGDLIHIAGVSSTDIIKFGQIILQIMLIPAVYATTKNQFGKNAAIISTFLVSASLPQFMVFWHSYYKNMLGIILMLSSIYLYDSKRYIPSAILAGFLGGVHRPTFMILLTSILIHSIITRRVMPFITAIVATFISFIFYLNTYKNAIFQIIIQLTKAQIGGGTFLNIKIYESVAIGYLPFGILGFIYYIAKIKKISPISIWLILTTFIVYFKVIFYNRFIIHFDMAILIFASFGFSLLMKTNKRIGTIALILLVGSSAWMVYSKSSVAEPLISQSELKSIEYLKKTESNAFVISTSSHYSPWLLGYSNRKVIAPGLFEYDKWDIDEWKEFWNTDNSLKAVEMLSIYEKPLYIYVGKYSPVNIKKFDSECFNVFYSDNKSTTIYKLIC